MKIIIFLLLHLSLYAEIVMDNGQCFERKGNMNYIVPCPSKRDVVQKRQQRSVASIEQNSVMQDNPCITTLGKYTIEYKSQPIKSATEISCVDAKEYIHSMFLGYEKSLTIGKQKIGELMVKRGFSHCNITLYYGEYITVGIMDGDKNMCNDFMAFHAQKRDKRMK